MRYPAIISHEDGATLAQFPDAPGCQTFTRRADIGSRAQEAIEGWLEVQLEERVSPPRPSSCVKAPRGASVEMVPINPILSARLALRWAREDAGLTQAQLAKRMGVSQQAYAKLESPDANFTMETLARAAKALGLRVEVDLAQSDTREMTVVR